MTEGAAGQEDLSQHIAEPHVIVVGGGIAGLVASRILARGGIRVTLLESGGALGGKVRPHVIDGIELDAGAESFATRGGTVAALATELGLGPDIVAPTAAGAWLATAAGTVLPLPKAGLLGIPSVPLAKDVIAVVGLAGALRAQLDSLLSGFVASKEPSFGRLVRKRMGSAVLDRLVAPVATAIHSAHPDDLLVDLVAPRLRTAILAEGSLSKAVLTLRGAAPAGAAVQGIRGGVFRLVDALASELLADPEVDVRLGTSVVDADGTSVTLTDGSRLDATAVVLTTQIRSGTGDAVGVTRGADITLATLVLGPGALDDAPRGTGVLVAAGAPGIRAKALTHATAKWPWLAELAAGRQVLRLSYEAAPASDAELREIARTDAERMLGRTISESAVIAFDRVNWSGPAITSGGSRVAPPVSRYLPRRTRPRPRTTSMQTNGQPPPCQPPWSRYNSAKGSRALALPP